MTDKIVDFAAEREKLDRNLEAHAKAFNELLAMKTAFAGWLNQQPPSREFSLAWTKIEEAHMWAVRGLTRDDT